MEKGVEHAERRGGGMGQAMRRAACWEDRGGRRGMGAREGCGLPSG